MPSGLKRFYGAGDLHFLTFSCYHRRPYLATSQAKYTFLSVLEQVRKRHRFSVTGYVLMPEHVHLLVSEPETGTPSRIIQGLKQNSSRRLKYTVANQGDPFWLTRFYDFNVRTEQKRVEKLRYMHRNPVTRGLVESPEHWEWSSFRHYLSGEPGIVEIDSGWRNQWKPD